MAKWLYDPHPPPTYPYIRATAAYSAAVQWYARSGQLPTAVGMKEKGQGRIRDAEWVAMRSRTHIMFLSLARHLISSGEMRVEK